MTTLASASVLVHPRRAAEMVQRAGSPGSSNRRNERLKSSRSTTPPWLKPSSRPLPIHVPTACPRSRRFDYMQFAHDARHLLRGLTGHGADRLIDAPLPRGYRMCGDALRAGSAALACPDNRTLWSASVMMLAQVTVGRPRVELECGPQRRTSCPRPRRVAAAPNRVLGAERPARFGSADPQPQQVPLPGWVLGIVDECRAGVHRHEVADELHVPGRHRWAARAAERALDRAPAGPRCHRFAPGNEEAGSLLPGCR